MKSRSNKAKGRRGQNAVRDKILSHFPTLHPEHVRCALMGETGSDIKLSPEARTILPYSIECKNQERVNVWDAIDQAQSNQLTDTEWAVFFKRNRSGMHVIIDADHFFDLVKRANGVKE